MSPASVITQATHGVCLDLEVSLTLRSCLCSRMTSALLPCAAVLQVRDTAGREETRFALVGLTLRGRRPGNPASSEPWRLAGDPAEIWHEMRPISRGLGTCVARGHAAPV